MIFQIVTFVIKHLLLKFGKNQFFQSEQDLKRVISEQNKLIETKDQKIIELQRAILNAGPRT